MQKNKLWFKKTKPECEFENILMDLKLKYKYMIFFKHKQFDFVIWGSKINIVVEVDGDYWHKSILQCKDEDERKLKRLEDSLKDNIITSLQSDKKYYIVRFWESDIQDNRDEIINYIKRLIGDNINGTSSTDSIIQEIKAYYTRKG